MFSFCNRFYFLLAVAFFAAPSYLHAIEVQDVSVASSVWKIVISLIFIILFIPACLWLMKRFQLVQMKLGQSGIKIINAQALGTKEKLLLVEVEGERMLIGVTSHAITHLRNFPPQKNSFSTVLEEVDLEGSDDEGRA